MKRVRAIISLSICVAAASCGGAGAGNSYTTGPGTQPGGGSNGSPTATNQITITDANSFNPGVVTVPAGTTVTWTWSSCSADGYGGYSACTSHNVTFDDGSNISSATQNSGTFSRTFAAAGTYKYHCSIHGAAMSGEVDVK